MSPPAPSSRAQAWALLEEAILQRRPLRARYHGHDRVLCPHALGWKNGRPKALCYQTGGTTSNGALTADSTQRWRSLFVDELHDPVIIDGPWQTAANYTPRSNAIDRIELALD